jgi:hypothetical protein
MKVDYENMKVVRFATTEGGIWVYPVNSLYESEVISMPIRNNKQGVPCWGIVHAYIREDGRRFDAANHDMKDPKPF